MSNHFKSQWWHRLQFRLSTIFIISFGLFVFLAFSLIQTNVSQVLEKKEWRNNELSNRAIIEELQRKTSVAHTLAASMANVATVISPNKKDYLNLFKSLLEGSPSQELIAGGGIWPEPYLFNPDTKRNSFFWGKDQNNTLQFFDDYNDPDGMGYHHEAWYAPIRYQSAGDVMWSSSYIDPYSKEPMVTCSIPIYKGKQYYGVSTVDMNLSGLTELVKSWTSTFGGYAIVVDRNGKLITKLPAQTPLGLDEFPTLDQLAIQNPAFKSINEAITKLTNKQFQDSQIDSFDPSLQSKLSQDSYQISDDEAKLISSIIQQPKKNNLDYLYQVSSFKMDMAPIVNEQSLISVSVMPETHWKVINIIPYSLITAEVKQKIELLLWPLILTAIASIGIIYLCVHVFFISRVKKIASQISLKNQNVTTSDIITADKGELGTIVNLFNIHNRRLIFQQNALDEHAIVSMTDVKGNITYANDKFKDISQYSHDELMGKNHRLLKSNFHPDSFFKEMWLTIASGKTWHGEIKNKAKDGSYYWVSSTIIPYLNEQGKPEQYISIRTDISDIKALEAKQQEANRLLLAEKVITEQEKQKAEKANQAKSEFLSSMSHELRTPMNAVLGFSNFLASDTRTPLTEDQLESVEQIIEGGEHLLSLINDVLDLSKIEMGQTDIYIEPVDIKLLISQVFLLIQPQAEQQSITLENKVTDETCFKIRADYTKLKQVLLNFSSNAVKYNSDNGKLTFSCKKTNNNKIKLLVSDTGNGVPEELFPSLFEPFNRLDKANSNIQGTGIGLSICKHLVELMEGEIGVFQNSDKGLTFWVEFKEV